MRTTKRLRELEADHVTRARATGPPSFKYLAEGRVQGYRMALEDLEAVLTAARNILVSVENGKGIAWIEFGSLRDALAGLED